jgi:hypothetical protein
MKRSPTYLEQIHQNAHNNSIKRIWNPPQNASIPEFPAAVRIFLRNRCEEMSDTVSGTM